MVPVLRVSIVLKTLRWAFGEPQELQGDISVM
jgi:hypothetical protein